MEDIDRNIKKLQVVEKDDKEVKELIDRVCSNFISIPNERVGDYQLLCGMQFIEKRTDHNNMFVDEGIIQVNITINPITESK